MAYTDLLRTNEGLPSIPDLTDMTEEQKISALYQQNKEMRDYIVRLKEQIGYEIKRISADKEG
ncbi:MAG: hypothetical protein ACI3XQ_11495 [Eubacteriales bacterium]